MKGFPNAINNIEKLEQGLQCIAEILANGENPRDDGILGRALVRSGITGSRSADVSPEDYIRDQESIRNHSAQGMRTSARLLREFYSLLGYVEMNEDHLALTELGRQVASFVGTPRTPEQLDIWRATVRGMEHFGRQPEASHPYRVLLNLIERKPGLHTSKASLALEARNDSREELDRIVRLADLEEADILREIGETKSNWDNARKILPGLAQQLGDVVKVGNGLKLAAHLTDVGGTSSTKTPRHGWTRQSRRSSRSVTAETLATGGDPNSFDEGELPNTADPEAIAAAIRARVLRFHRHNKLLSDFAELLKSMSLTAGLFDLLARTEELAVLVEAKTLDGSEPDERDRVREALSQLLYYESFELPDDIRPETVILIALFESEISSEHQEWLNESGIGVVWKDGHDFRFDVEAENLLGGYLK